MTDPTDSYGASMFHGTSPKGDDLMALARRFTGGIGQAFPDLLLREVLVTPDRSRIVVSGVFTLPSGGRREFRSWTTLEGDNFTYSIIEAPEGRLEGVKGFCSPSSPMSG